MGRPCARTRTVLCLHSPTEIGVPGAITGFFDVPRSVDADHNVPRWRSIVPAIACCTRTPYQFAPGRGAEGVSLRWPGVARLPQAVPAHRRRLGSRRPGWPRACSQRETARKDGALSLWGSSWTDAVWWRRRLSRPHVSRSSSHTTVCHHALKPLQWGQTCVYPLKIRSQKHQQP
jgi:hypothetical protein